MWAGKMRRGSRLALPFMTISGHRFLGGHVQDRLQVQHDNIRHCLLVEGCIL